MNEAQITISGNLTGDPELRYTPSGVPVANFRVASTPKNFDKQAGEWVEGEALFITCTAWKSLGENTARTLGKGMRVLVTGDLRQRSYRNHEGEQRISIEMDVRDIGPSLKWADAEVRRNRNSGRQGGGRQYQQQSPASDSWRGQPTGGTGGFSAGADDGHEPPF